MPIHRSWPLLVVALASGPGGAVAGNDNWNAARTVDGVPLQFRPSASGHRAYRGTTRVCTTLTELQAFVADADRFAEWIPYTEAARALPHDGRGDLYYLRTSTPWPLESRDMVYRLDSVTADGDTLQITIRGVPDALPPQPDAVRMAGADGLWTLRSDDGGIDVTLRMAIDVGGAPAFLANRRLAATVGGALANLRAHFPCDR